MDFNLNPFAVSGLLIGLTSSVILIIIFLYSKRNRLHNIFGLHNLSVAIWGYGSFLIAITYDQAISMKIWKVAYSGVILIPVFFIHAVFELCNKKNKILLFFAYLQGITFLFLTISGRLFSQLILVANSFYYLKATTIFLISFLIWMFMVIYGHYVLLRFYIVTKKDNKRQIFYLALSNLAGFSGGVTNFFPAFNNSFYPFGNFAVPLYSIFLSYAILKYQLMDINIVIRKSIVYSILITILTIIYLSAVITTEKLFQGIIGYRSVLFSIVSVSIIAIIFAPLKNKIQSFIDRLFLGKTPEQIAQENEFLRQEILRSEKLKTIATFASGMAHEIKNPLTAIKTFTEFLPQKLDDKEFLRKFSDIVNSETEKIDDLVRQLLDFSKPHPLQLEETDIHKLIDDTLEILSSHFIKYNIKIIKEYNTNFQESNTNKHELVVDKHEFIREDSSVISGNSCLVRVDPQQMKQVFMNLFINAIEAMSRGGILTVSTSIEHPASNIEPAENEQFIGNKSVLICVQDTGCGISEKDLLHIFEPFYTTKEKGSGLGLSIVYNIIKEHKGNIAIGSVINEGAKFIIKLPLR